MTARSKPSATPGAAREPCAERGEKRLVRRVAREAGARALRGVARKASGLLGCIAELIESVRQLDRAPEGLEPGGNRLLRSVPARPATRGRRAGT